MMSIDKYGEYLKYASILDDKFLIIETIGFGRYAKVKLAIDKDDKQRYAIKIMKNDPTVNETKIQAFINEAQSLADCDHKNIIRIVQCQINGEYKKIDGRVIQVSYLVMELADQGELYELIEQTHQFSEKFSRTIFQQVIKGIEYMHTKHIVHRDIKSENILFKNGILKLADFGFSAKTIDETGQKLQLEVSQYLGSPEYNPPELSNIGKQKFYSPESADIFAAGVILFTMVMRSAPFKSTKNTDQYYQLFRQNKQQFWGIYGDLNNHITLSFQDLIEKMLEENPLKRITLEQINKHQWMQGPISNPPDFQTELKNRYEILQNKVKSNTSLSKKFQKRKYIKKQDFQKVENNPPTFIQESLEIIETINAKLTYKNHPQGNFNYLEKPAPDEQKLETKLDTNKIETKKHKRNSEGQKKSSPATPPNDSDN